jgi:hypothetical protein
MQAGDLTQDELLGERIDAALRDGDDGRLRGKLAALLSETGVSEAGKDAALRRALESGRAAAVRCVFEVAKPALSDLSCICLVSEACKRQHFEVALYLCEKTAELGLDRVDGFALIFGRFPPDRHEAAVRRLLDYAADKQDALDKLLLAAADEKALGVIPLLLGLGADPNAANGAGLALLARAHPPEDKADKQTYLALLDAYLGKFQVFAALDAALPMAAGEIAAGKQYPEVALKLLDKGADPWKDGAAAAQILKQQGAAPPAGTSWQELFAEAREKDTAAAQRVFEALYPASPNIEQLRRAAVGGETGLTLAGRARLYDRLDMSGLTIDDLAQPSARGVSALSLALDRGDLKALLDPARWTKDDLRAAESRLTPAEAQRADLPGLTALFNRHKLKEKVREFRLAPKPRTPAAKPPKAQP